MTKLPHDNQSLNSITVNSTKVEEVHR